MSGAIQDPTVLAFVKDGKWRSQGGKAEAGRQRKQLSETMFYVYPLTGSKLRGALIYVTIVAANVLLLLFMLECSPGSSKQVRVVLVTRTVTTFSDRVERYADTQPTAG